MAALQRYTLPLEPTPHEKGCMVRFADVEEALGDRDRLEWLLPLLGGVAADDALIDCRNAALTLGVLSGLTGRALVDFARRRAVQ